MLLFTEDGRELRQEVLEELWERGGHAGTSTVSRDDGVGRRSGGILFPISALGGARQTGTRATGTRASRDKTRWRDLCVLASSGRHRSGDRKREVELFESKWREPPFALRTLLSRAH